MELSIRAASEREVRLRVDLDELWDNGARSLQAGGIGALADAAMRFAVCRHTVTDRNWVALNLEVSATTAIEPRQGPLWVTARVVEEIPAGRRAAAEISDSNGKHIAHAESVYGRPAALD